MSLLQITLMICVFVTILAYTAMFMVAAKRKKASKKKKQKIEPSKKRSSSKNGRSDIENKIGIEKVSDNVIVEKNGRVNVVLEYSTPDIPSLKEEEVLLYEKKLMRMAVSLKCDIKTIEYSGTVKTIKANTHILETVDSGILTEQAATYARQLAASLGEKQFDRKEVEKKKYIVIGAKEDTVEASVTQLKKYVEAIVTNLDKTNVKVHLLETTALLDRLNEIINYGSKLDVEMAETEGVFELFATGGIKRREDY